MKLKSIFSKNHLVFWIIFPIALIIGLLFSLFYIDLTGGPILVLVLTILTFLALIALSIIFINKKLWQRWTILTSFSLTIFILLGFSKPYESIKSAAYYKNPVSTEVMEIDNGKIQGVYNEDKSVEIYAGIPYAKPPVGELRWKEPQDAENWDGVRDCSYFAPKAMQQDSLALVTGITDLYGAKQYVPDFSYTPLEYKSEDCLYLNVWKPNTDETNLPVLVYIHGGSLSTGSSSFEAYNGESMAKTGVIMITIAYRLNVFGYFAHPDLKEESLNNTTGNYGLLDQIKALKWVNENIHYFGGDKDNITIAGESAGSSSVSAICSSPLAKGLFKRAIGESSSVVTKEPPHTFRSYEEAIEVGQNIMDEFKCSSIAELRKIDASKLVNTSYANSSMTVDGYALEKMPYEVYEAHENNEEALLNGCNSMEADAFVIPQYILSFQSQTNKNNIKERLLTVFDEVTVDKILALYDFDNKDDAFTVMNEIMSAWWFIYPHHSWCRYLSENTSNIYRYYFDKSNHYYSGYHSGELPYAYGNVKSDPKTYRYNESDYKLEDTMLSYWSNFVKTGDPNGEGLPTWSKWEETKNLVQELGDNVGPIEDQYSNLYSIFDEYLASK